jgi:membrane protease subunit (stomatin/prohibitin family)
MSKLDLIEYQGDNQLFICKHPIENFAFGSQLIVRESQEAIFFLNGKGLDLFGPGRHTLETQKLPLRHFLVIFFAQQIIL